MSQLFHDEGRGEEEKEGDEEDDDEKEKKIFAQYIFSIVQRMQDFRSPLIDSYLTRSTCPPTPRPEYQSCTKK